MSTKPCGYRQPEERGTEEFRKIRYRHHISLGHSFTHRMILPDTDAMLQWNSIRTLCRHHLPRAGSRFPMTAMVVGRGKQNHRRLAEKE